MIIDCEKCVTGKKALDIHFARKRKEISYHQTVKQLEEIGKICFSCMHNKIKGKKAKVYALTKVITKSAGMLDFQSCDWYEEIHD
jgi:hypothetical protein